MGAKEDLGSSMHNKVKIVSVIALLLLSQFVLAREVIITNKLSKSHLVIQELYSNGIKSEIKESQIILGPSESKHWIVRIPAREDYLYTVKVFVASDPGDFSKLRAVCKCFAFKYDSQWVSLYPNSISCHNDNAFFNSSNYDPENEPFSVVVTPIDVKPVSGEKKND